LYSEWGAPEGNAGIYARKELEKGDKETQPGPAKYDIKRGADRERGNVWTRRKVASLNGERVGEGGKRGTTSHRNTKDCRVGEDEKQVS